MTTTESPNKPEPGTYEPFHQADLFDALLLIDNIESCIIDTRYHDLNHEALARVCYDLAELIRDAWYNEAMIDLSPDQRRRRLYREVLGACDTPVEILGILTHLTGTADS